MSDGQMCQNIVMDCPLMFKTTQNLGFDASADAIIIAKPVFVSLGTW
jgi:hypothetical protein